MCICALLEWLFDSANVPHTGSLSSEGCVKLLLPETPLEAYLLLLRQVSIPHAAVQIVECLLDFGLDGIYVPHECILPLLHIIRGSLDGIEGMPNKAP